VALMTTRALVLARGLGTRMRQPDGGVPLTREQQQAADAGLKTMMPVNGRPFLDYVLGSLADAGLRDIALVVAPDHDLLRQHLAAARAARLRVEFVVQEQPLGTANAVLAAEAWTAGAPFLAMNADNLYPVEALRDLASLDEPGFPAFDADDLIHSSNIPAERIRAFALVTVDEAGYLTSIVEKPANAEIPPEGGSYADGVPDLPPEGGSYIEGSVASAFRRNNAVISMNCWRLDARIFPACRDVPRSARGEFELPEAVGLASARGVRFKAVPARGPVLDLSRRADAADVERRLAGHVPCL
jgi:glucose-1-phosphate thymidylyltransferase